MTIVFYISGHGFGHATRDVEVISHLLRARPDIRIVVRTLVPAWFIERSAKRPIEVQSCHTDTGVTQIDSLHLDASRTAREAARFYSDFGARIDAEANIIVKHRASLVVGDIPPLAFAAAARAGVPSIALANFTWDWIYDAYPEFKTLAQGVVSTIGGAYTQASLALRLPFHGGFDSMREVTLDVPLVARRSELDRDEVRRRLRLEGSRPVILASFGGHGTRLPIAEVAAELEATLVATDYEVGRGGPDVRRDRLRLFSGDELTRLDLRYEDLVAAADIVVGKPGYGIVSECIANGTALLYTSRGHFVENDVMVPEMARVLRCRFISQDDLREGRWQDAVEGLLAQALPPDRMRTDGAEIVAATILAACCSAPGS